MNLREVLTKARKRIPFTTILVGIISGIFGIFVSPIIELATQPFFSYDNMPAAIFILVTLVFLTLVVIWENMRLDWKNTTFDISYLNREVQKVSELAGQSVSILNYGDGLRAIRERAKLANEALLYTGYIYDWNTGKPLQEDSIFNHPERIKNLEYALERFDMGLKTNTGRYIRVVSVPKGNKIESLFECDAPLKKECEYLGKVALTQPERGSVRVTDCVFQNSFIILDRTFLHLDFNILDSGSDVFSSSFSLVINDPDSKLVQELVRLHERLQARATLYTKQ